MKLDNGIKCTFREKQGLFFRKGLGNSNGVFITNDENANLWKITEIYCPKEVPRKYIGWQAWFISIENIHITDSGLENIYD